MRNFTAEARSRPPIHHGGTEARRSEEDRGIGRAAAPSFVQSAWKIIRATLREIFDESAYERFLLRARAPRSAESYRAFMREQEAGIAQKPKCC
jgi:hypothetical protein